MKRIAVTLGIAALMVVGVASVGASPLVSSSITGRLSASAREQATVPRTATTGAGASTTRTTRTPEQTTATRRSATSVPATPMTALTPTTPTTPTTMSRTGVAGVVLYERGCSADRPCKLEPGPATVRLVDAYGDVIARGAANDHGWFVLEAPNGKYVLQAKPASKKDKCGDVDLEVKDGYTTARIQCGARRA